jgi:hypothetical protein
MFGPEWTAARTAGEVTVAVLTPGWQEEQLAKMELLNADCPLTLNSMNLVGMSRLQA